MQVHVLPEHPHITKPTHTHTQTLQKKIKQPQYKFKKNIVQDMLKWNSQNTIKYTQYKVTLMYVALYPQELHRDSLHLTSK